MKNPESAAVLFENVSALGRVYYEFRYAMAKRPCARHEGLWKSGHVDPLIRDFSTWWKLQAPVALPSREEPTVLIAYEAVGGGGVLEPIWTFRTWSHTYQGFI